MLQNGLAWLCLVGAAVGQTAWTYSLKFMQLSTLKTLRWSTVYRLSESWIILAPWVGYLVLGAVNAVLLAIAMRTISTTTAFAVWMAMSLVFLKIGDIVWFRANWSMSELFFIGLIAAGIIGLKVFSAPA